MVNGVACNQKPLHKSYIDIICILIQSHQTATLNQWLLNTRLYLNILLICFIVARHTWLTCELNQCWVIHWLKINIEGAQRRYQTLKGLCQQWLNIKWWSLAFWDENWVSLHYKVMSKDHTCLTCVMWIWSILLQASWKKFLIDLMYLRGQVTLYPNFPNQTSFSTNHMEPGAHIAASDNVVKHNKDDFEVPLLQVRFSNFPSTPNIIPSLYYVHISELKPKMQTRYLLWWHLLLVAGGLNETRCSIVESIHIHGTCVS